MVMGQALSNVLGPERYGVVADQVIRYVLGSFGKPTAPVEPWVLDRILDRPRARELVAEPPPLSVAELRQRLPRGISDEELLLRFAMPAGAPALHPGGAAGAAAAARARGAGWRVAPGGGEARVPAVAVVCGDIS